VPFVTLLGAAVVLAAATAPARLSRRQALVGSHQPSPGVARRSFLRASASARRQERLRVGQMQVSEAADGRRPPGVRDRVAPPKNRSARDTAQGTEEVALPSDAGRYGIEPRDPDGLIGSQPPHSSRRGRLPTARAEAGLLVSRISSRPGNVASWSNVLPVGVVRNHGITGPGRWVYSPAVSATTECKLCGRLSTSSPGSPPDAACTVCGGRLVEVLSQTQRR
jgi:hypothetical protein